MDAPATRTITLYGVSYEVDLRRCRLEMPKRVLELRAEGRTGSLRSMIADLAGVDPATVSRFLSGNKDLGADAFLAILTKGLKLELSDVARPIEEAS